MNLSHRKPLAEMINFEHKISVGKEESALLFLQDVTHYGRFCKILSQNWGMNFCSCGFIFILFLKILASKAQKTVDHMPSYDIFEIETKLHLQGLNFKLEFWDTNLRNRP